MRIRLHSSWTTRSPVQCRSFIFPAGPCRIKFQLHDYIARKILHQPPQSCNYADNKEIGTWLNNILKKGATEDWRKVLKEATGEDISTRAMAEYFKPLQSWLEEQNKGRQIGWE